MESISAEAAGPGLKFASIERDGQRGRNPSTILWARRQADGAPRLGQREWFSRASVDCGRDEESVIRPNSDLKMLLLHSNLPQTPALRSRRSPDASSGGPFQFGAPVRILRVKLQTSD